MRWSDKEKRKWHRWFAWYPVTIPNPDAEERVTFWLQSVWRVRVDGFPYPYWIYSGYANNPEDR